MTYGSENPPLRSLDLVLFPVTFNPPKFQCQVKYLNEKLVWRDLIVSKWKRTNFECVNPGLPGFSKVFAKFPNSIAYAGHGNRVLQVAVPRCSTNETSPATCVQDYSASDLQLEDDLDCSALG